MPFFTIINKNGEITVEPGGLNEEECWKKIKEKMLPEVCTKPLFQFINLSDDQLKAVVDGVRRLHK